MLEPVALFADVGRVACGCIRKYDINASDDCSLRDGENKNHENLSSKELLRTVFDRYLLINPSTHPHDPSTTLHNNKNQRNAAADAYRAPPRKQNSRHKQLLHAAFVRYVLNRPTILSRDPTSTLYTNDKQINAISNTYRTSSLVCQFFSLPRSLRQQQQQ